MLLLLLQLLRLLLLLPLLLLLLLLQLLYGHQARCFVCSIIYVRTYPVPEVSA